jgi:hypothetical protein
MEFAVRHFIRGRLRLFVPWVCRRRMLAQAMLDWLRAQASIKLARINYDCASLVIEYDTADEPLLRALLGRLRLMTVDELRALLGSTPRRLLPPRTDNACLALSGAPRPWRCRASRC